MSVQTGTLIDDKYEVIDTIGVGGFGAVYSVIQKQFDRRVAVKTLNTTLLLERDGAARFEREAKAINGLHHKNIVAFYGYGVWQGAPYMVMEFVDGPSLERVIRQEKCVEPLRALRLMKQVFEGLRAAHAAGVVHRDLKPSNIIITREVDGSECVKIIDFGLAKLMPGYGVPGQKLTETGYALGTCSYMPPEQALGVPVDGRADIYAAGCILYQMLAGKLPFEGDDNIAVMMQHIHNQAEPLAKYIVPPAPAQPVSVFVANCMGKEREERYQSCADALQDLDNIFAGRYTSVTPLAVRVASTPKTRVRISAAPLIATAAVLGLVCGAFAWISGTQSRNDSMTADGGRYAAEAMKAYRACKESPQFVALFQSKQLFRALEPRQQIDCAARVIYDHDSNRPLTAEGMPLIVEAATAQLAAIQRLAPEEQARKKGDVEADQLILSYAELPRARGQEHADRLADSIRMFWKISDNSYSKYALSMIHNGMLELAKTPELASDHVIAQLREVTTDIGRHQSFQRFYSRAHDYRMRRGTGAEVGWRLLQILLAEKDYVDMFRVAAYIRKEPGAAWSVDDLVARAYVADGQFDVARKQFEKLQPQDPDAAKFRWRWLARTALLQNKLQDAKEFFSKCGDDDNDSAMLRAALLERTGHRDAAAQLLAKQFAPGIERHGTLHVSQLDDTFRANYALIGNIWPEGFPVEWL